MIQTSDSSRLYVGNNSITVPYPVPFQFLQDEDLVVVVRDISGLETTQALHTDYTVMGAGDPNGGSIKTTWAVPVNQIVSIVRMVEATQLTVYEEADAFPAKSHERALDKLTMLVQQALRVTGGESPTALGSAFRVTDASLGINAVAKLSDSALGIDALGNAILRTPSDMLSWLGQVGTVWTNTAERLNTAGAFAGQLGVQIDNRTIYIAGSTTPGDWLPFLIGTGIVAATDGVPHLMTPPAGDLVGTDQSQTLYNKTLESPTIHTPTGLTKSDVGLSQVDNSSDLNKPLSAATGAALAFKQDKNEKGISNGYPSLDGGGKVPIAQIPDAVIGASQYQGTWNAATNTPTIPAAAVGNKGWYYSVSVAGTTNINGINSWAVGDQIISNGTVWQKIVNVSAVSSVNTKTGAVVLVPADLSLGNVDNTSDATKNAAAVTLTNHTVNGANNTLTVRLDADVTNNLPTSRLNNGTGASGTTWWCGDGSWKQPPGTGDVGGPAGSTDGEVALYSGTTGKILRRYSGLAGLAKVTATGGLSATPKIMAIDVDPDAITGQTEKAGAVEDNDKFLLVDQGTGQLRYMRGNNVAPLPKNYLSGLTMFNNTSDTANDLDIAPGVARDTTDTCNITIGAMTKRLDAAWVAGTNQGGRDTGAIADAWWHVFAIWNPTTGVGDVLFSQSLTSPTLPSGFTAKRRIGSVYRHLATHGGIRSFVQRGDYFIWPILIFEANAVGIAFNGSFTPTMAVPPGLKIQFVVNYTGFTNTAPGAATVRDPDLTSNFNVIATAVTNVAVCGQLTLWSNASSQILFFFSTGSGSFVITLATAGYWDQRGRQGSYVY